MSDVEEKALSEMVRSGAFEARQDGLGEVEFDTVSIWRPHSSSKDAGSRSKSRLAGG